MTDMLWPQPSGAKPAIVTNNVRDFPESALATWNVEAGGNIRNQTHL